MKIKIMTVLCLLCASCSSENTDPSETWHAKNIDALSGIWATHGKKCHETSDLFIFQNDMVTLARKKGLRNPFKNQAIMEYRDYRLENASSNSHKSLIITMKPLANVTEKVWMDFEFKIYNTDNIKLLKIHGVQPTNYEKAKKLFELKRCEGEILDSFE